MRILDNYGISKTGIETLTNAGFEVTSITVAQNQLINYINQVKEEQVTMSQYEREFIQPKQLEKLQEEVDLLQTQDLKSIEEISQARERDNFMTADEAKKFGLIDSVVDKRK